MFQIGEQSFLKWVCDPTLIHVGFADMEKIRKPLRATGQNSWSASRACLLKYDVHDVLDHVPDILPDKLRCVWQFRGVTTVSHDHELGTVVSAVASQSKDVQRVG